MEPPPAPISIISMTGTSTGRPGALLEAVRARHLELAGHQRRAAVDDAGLGRGPSHVEGEHAQLAPLAGGQRGGQGPGGGTGLHEADGEPARRRRQRDAARGLHDVELSGNAVLGEARLQIGEVARHEGSHVDVGRGGRCSLVLADLGDDVGRARDGQARRHVLDQLGQTSLVDWIDVGVEQADGQRLDALGEKLPDHRARRGLVERPRDAAVGVEPLRDLPPQVARHEGRRGLDEEVVHVVAPLVADLQGVAEPHGREERGAGPLALDQRVGGQRRPVDDRAHLRDGHLRLPEERDDARLHAVGGVLGRGEHFPHAQSPGGFVHDDEIRERAADVDAEPRGHGRECTTVETLLRGAARSVERAATDSRSRGLRASLRCP